jgi:iron complex transport system permease protein
VVLVFSLGRSGRLNDENALLLSGVMIGAFLSAVILALVSVSGSEMRGALFWLIGFLGNARLEDVFIATGIVLPAMVLLLAFAPSMNVLTLGAETARTLGLRYGRIRGMLYVTASMITAAVVSFSGSIGFVGLIIPHTMRMLVGPDHRALLPTSFFAGAGFLIISDIVARTAISPSELPVGAVTAALGAPLFVYLLRRKSQ